MRRSDVAAWTTGALASVLFAASLLGDGGGLLGLRSAAWAYVGLLALAAAVLAIAIGLPMERTGRDSQP